MAVTLREIDDANRDAVLALRLAPGQHRFVSTVDESLAEAERDAHARPWFRAVHDGDEVVGFVMLSWDVTPDPPEIHGPWFLWKLLVDERHQRKGYGREVVRAVADLVRAQGGAELLTSFVDEEGGPRDFYLGLGFVPTGELDPDGEVILRLSL